MKTDEKPSNKLLLPRPPNLSNFEYTWVRFCEMSSNFVTSYVSCGCNKSPHAADWGRNGLICFGSCESIAIYDPLASGGGGKITHTLHGHKGKVNAVRWLNNFLEKPEYGLISASADGTCMLWSYNEDRECYIHEHTLSGHTNIVNIADGLLVSPSTSYLQNTTPLIVASASVDSTVRIYRRKDGEDDLNCIDILDWESGFCVDVRLALLPEANLALLACAADDGGLHLFVETQPSEVNEADTGHEFNKIHVIVGHTDWIRSIDFVIDVYNDLYLATGSQDTHVRVYKFHAKTDKTMRHKKIFDDSEEFQPEESTITVLRGNNEYHFALTLETILSGHDGWVYSVCWYPPLHNSDARGAPHAEILGASRMQKIQLLSVSLDKTMIVWAPSISGTWTEVARLGEVGGSSLGFYGGKFGEDGQAIMGHGYLGTFHIWRYDEETKNWEPSVVIGGHTDAVVDMTWDVEGNYILSVGQDQTTRLHAPWVHGRHNNKITWHELARPQIHGYDMTCIAPLGPYKFASGAEEKVIRAFSAPSNFIENFKRISRISDCNFSENEEIPQGASVPALGLSNKPVFEELKREGYLIDDEYPDLYFSPIHLKRPPTEENLMQNTLWPELQKLYGHGFEIYSLAARHDGIVLASSCKASTPEHAAIILWNAKTWLIIQKLMAHQLTVTQMSFSPDGKYLLSVSRDRRWSLFAVTEDGKTYDWVTSSESKSGFHQRIIWCCAWTFDSLAFATGSREGKVGFWSRIDPEVTEPFKGVKLMASLHLGKESVTALAFTPILRRGYHILAVGLENGSIHLYRYLDTKVENLWVVFQGYYAHHLAVKRLAFRPKLGRTGVAPNEELHYTNILQLASCGADHLLKIYDVFLHLL